MGKEKKRLPVGVENFEQIIKDVAGGMQFLLNSEVLNDYDKSDYKALLDSSMSEAVLCGGLRRLSELLEKHYGDIENKQQSEVCSVDWMYAYLERKHFYRS